MAVMWVLTTVATVLALWSIVVVVLLALFHPWPAGRHADTGGHHEMASGGRQSQERS